MTMDTDQRSDEGQPYPDDEVDLLYVLGVLWRGKWITIATTVLFGGFAFVYALGSLLLPPEDSYMPNVYEPTALLIVNEDSGTGGIQAALADSGIPGIGGLRGAAGPSFGERAVKLLSSRTVQDPIIDEFGLIARWEIEEQSMIRARRELRDRSRFGFEPETGTLEIGFEDRDPEFAQEVVNAYVDAVNGIFADIGGTRAQTRMELFEEQMDKLEREIVEFESEIEAFQTEYGVPDVRAFASQQTEFISEVRSELVMTELELQTSLEFMGAQDAQVRRLQAERENLQQLADEIETGWRTFPGVGPSQQELPGLQRDFARLERELNVRARVYETIRGQYEVARLNAEGDEPVMQVYERAEVPDLKSGPARSIMVIVATAAGFFLGIFLTFLAHFVHNVRHDPEAVRRFRGE